MTLDVKAGDKVFFSKYQGTEVSHDGKDYLIIAYRDIFAVIND
jgi:chaperonin GroES